MPEGSGELVVIVRPAGEIVNVRALEVPTLGVITVMLAVPGAAISVAGMSAVSREALTKVVVRLEPFHLTRLLESKLAPFTAKVNAGPPAIAEVGLTEVS